MKNRFRIEVFPDAFLLAALLLLMVPIKWVCSAFLAAVIHEGGHLIALKLCRVSVNGITVRASGAKIHTGYQTLLDELICALAGPVFGLCGMVVFGAYPVVGICCLGQSLFNLLPVFPFDGGRVVLSLLCLIYGVRRGKDLFFVCQRLLIAVVLFGILLLTIRFVMVN